MTLADAVFLSRYEIRAPTPRDSDEHGGYAGFPPNKPFDRHSAETSRTGPFYTNDYGGSRYYIFGGFGNELGDNDGSGYGDDGIGGDGRSR